ncbi:MAG: SGNH/GDSL hydrolase family protein [Clostridiales bacterium]|nr:SGNH/GDSL hydrolase family protein [Clostridiales bacterium]
MSEKIYIYGDSIMKATVPDDEFHYHFHLNQVMQPYEKLPVEIVNRAKMGATVTKGQSLLEHDLERGMEARYALLAFGGNDCDFDWSAVAASPQQEHQPHTELPHFLETLTSMIGRLKERGVQPVLMTLPPIDAGKYLNFICRDGLSREKILSWLGDCQMIYRFQEMYSDAVGHLAERLKLPLLDVRSAFLGDHNFWRMNAADGIHLTDEGYQFLFGHLAGSLTAKLEG